MKIIQMKRSNKQPSNPTNRKAAIQTVGEFDFLARANALVEENLMATNGKGVTLGMNADQLESFDCYVGQLEEKAPVFLPMLPELLAHTTKYRDLGAVMLVVFDWDEYEVAPWTAPSCWCDTQEEYELVLDQVGDTPFEWNFDVEQVFHAFRLDAKDNPVCVYALQYTGEKLIYVFQNGQWHKFAGLDSVIELALDRALPGDNWSDYKEDNRYLDHKEMLQAFAKNTLLSQMLLQWEERSEKAHEESDRQNELSVQQWEAEQAAANA